MNAIPNTKVDVLRGTTALPNGDVEDSDTIVITGMPVSIAELIQRVRNEADQKPATIRYYVGRCRGNRDVRQGDRLRDNGTGVVWVVNAVHAGAGEIGSGTRPVSGIASDLIMDLQRSTSRT
jgi:hypothetical protein